MAYRDLREFLSLLESKGELIRIREEVDWNEEIGAVAQEAAFRNAPSIIFENIRDNKETPGKKLAMLYLCGWKRFNLALELPEDTPPREILQVWRKRYKNPIKPIIVSEGPCKENVKKGEDVNLYDFPIPKLHRRDGGRYMLTWHMDITKDPDSDWINCGLYRGMVINKNSIARYMATIQHITLHAMKYHKLGRPLPLSVAIGTDPIGVMVACLQVPAGINEYDIMGGIKEAPVELIKCETNGLLVPANSEIVLEGEVSMDPETFVPEGPFGEYPGYYSDVKPQLSPVFKVNCITHRNDPIMTSCLLGTGPDLVPADHEYFCSITMAAQIWDHLERCGVLGIDDVSLDLNATSTIVYIAINKMYYGQAKQVAAALWGGPLSIYLGKYVIVVDSDVDIRDRGRIMSAIANRTYPKSDIIIYPGTFGGPLDPGTPPEIKDIYGRMGHWDRVLIDATWPFEWKPREEWGGSKHPVSCLAEEDTLEKVRNKWGMYGFK